MDSANVSKYANSTNGPLGLGDPEDTSLRKVERNVKIPQKMRDKARTEKCVDLVKAFMECGKQNKILFFMNCRAENKLMQECYARWFNDEGFRQECTNEYLKERAVYRRTGETVIPEKLHR
ncbi:COX assembly mitochondrial protein homolog [Nilaparvata lugens]|uniref:COX assembly mitochondrial protein homolog n=1 Tax=Nilaparvata lugens TaxID=108931 RepID=UPI00193EB739|nr:COX assembly mitochondrial protein homolog [Nilaparvata lugens]